MLVTQAEFSRMKGVSRKTVTAWKAARRLVFSGKLVDVEASQERLRRTVQIATTGRRRDIEPVAGGHNSAAGSPSARQRIAAPRTAKTAVPKAARPNSPAGGGRDA